MDLVQEGLPPEMQLINQLLAAEYPEGTRKMLQDRREEITPELVDLMGRMAEEMAQREDEEAAETVKRLRDIRAQATLLA
jgi:hypothetical protein